MDCLLEIACDYKGEMFSNLNCGTFSVLGEKLIGHEQY